MPVKTCEDLFFFQLFFAFSPFLRKKHIESGTWNCQVHSIRHLKEDTSTHLNSEVRSMEAPEAMEVESILVGDSHLPGLFLLRCFVCGFLSHKET